MADSPGGLVRCPECWRHNLPTTHQCRHCGAALMIDEVDPPRTIRKPSRFSDPRLFKGYGVVMWILALLIVIATIVLTIIYSLMPNTATWALFTAVAGTALAVIHLICGYGLWLERVWARRAAINMHMIVVIWAILYIGIALTDITIPYIKHLFTPPILLLLIGGGAVWAGMGAEEGERLEAYGPDPATLPGDIRPINEIVHTPMPDDALYPQRVNLPDGPQPVPVGHRIAGSGYDDPQAVRKEEQWWRKAMMGGLMMVFMGILGDAADNSNDGKGRKRNNLGIIGRLLK